MTAAIQLIIDVMQNWSIVFLSYCISSTPMRDACNHIHLTRITSLLSSRADYYVLTGDQYLIQVNSVQFTVNSVHIIFLVRKTANPWKGAWKTFKELSQVW
jgi:hypothetical protein